MYPSRPGAQPCQYYLKTGMFHAVPFVIWFLFIVDSNAFVWIRKMQLLSALQIRSSPSREETSYRSISQRLLWFCAIRFLSLRKILQVQPSIARTFATRCPRGFWFILQQLSLESCCFNQRTSCRKFTIFIFWYMRFRFPSLLGQSLLITIVLR